MRYYKRVKNDKTVAVEKYSHNLPVPDTIEINKQEYDEFIKNMPAPELPEVRDLEKEIDEIKGRINALEK